MLKDYLKAGYPALCVLTQEPHRTEQIIPSEGWRFLSWDCIAGIQEPGSGRTIEEIQDPVEAINWLNGFTDTVLITHNLHLFLDLPEVIQAILNGIVKWKSTGCCLVMVSPRVKLTPEIEKFFHVIDMPLPETEALYDLQCEMGREVNVKPNKKAARAAKGLTEFECETAFALSLVKQGYFSTRIISETKAQMIRKSGLLEFWEPTSIQDVGGLNALKEFISNRAKAFMPENENLPRPKGILLVGIPGTGKSLSSKAAASILNWPLLRLDIGSLKGSLVGESERKMRQATQVIDAFGEAVIWLDEVEKGFAGSKSSGETDAGTTANMLGYFLTWMQETKTSVMIMATANDITKLPPEFMRAGRFDATFFVDLPSTSERIEIIKIMNRRYKTDLPLELSQKLQGYTGAEIEQLAKDSLFEGLENAHEALVPLSRTMREDIQSLRDWAKTRARKANTQETGIKDTRRIRTLSNKPKDKIPKGNPDSKPQDKTPSPKESL